MQPFSERQGYTRAADIVVREDAPEELREYILLVVTSELGFGWLFLRDLLCLTLREAPRQYTRTYEIQEEVRGRIHSCEWFRVYDFIERLHERIRENDAEQCRQDAPLFQQSINAYFIQNGIGWQLEGGQIITRGDEAFEDTVNTAAAALEAANRPTAASHLHNAILALSARPEANTSGAVSHATSAVECVLNAITGDAMTLSDYLKKYPDLLHGALKNGLNSIYGYASDEGARHGKEGTQPSLEDAEFVVATCAAICTFLTKKHPKEDR